MLDVGFDTASSIALLGVSALAKKNTDGTPMSSGHIIILPVNFSIFPSQVIESALEPNLIIDITAPFYGGNDPS